MPRRSHASPRRYAQAVYDIARAAGTTEEWEESLRSMAEASRSPELVALLEAPGITPQEKREAMGRVLPDLPGLAYNLLALLAHRRAVGLLPEIREAYRERLDAATGVQRVEVTSAVPLEGLDRERIRGQLAASLGRDVRVTAVVDPALLGGLLVRVGDRVLDGSVRGRLAAMRRGMAQGPR